MQLNETGFKNYKLLMLLAMILLTTDLASSVIAYKFIKVGVFQTSAALFVVILCYPLVDIIAEVYGLNILKKVIWFQLICDYLFCIFIQYGLSYPGINTWHNQNCYEIVLGNFWRLVLASTVSILISGLINGYFLLKWKILLHGRKFWLRSIGSTLIGIMCKDILAFFTAFGGIVNLKKLLYFISSSFMLTIMFVIVITPITTICCNLIKKIEGVDVYEKKLNWNPFKIN